jgi:ABC-2 type transport system ATP-binding protein
MFVFGTNERTIKSRSQKQLEYWFEKLEIQGWWNKKIQELSKGMAQKFSSSFVYCTNQNC